MINFLLFLNFAAMLSGVVFYWIETKRRKEAEAAIFSEITRSLNAEIGKVKDHGKLVDSLRFLIKRSRFHRQLVDGLANRIEDQELCFAEFGSFISHFVSVFPAGAFDDMDTKRRLDKMREHLSKSKGAYKVIVDLIDNQEAETSA